MSKSEEDFYPPPGQQVPTNQRNSVTGGPNPVQQQNQLVAGKSHHVPPGQQAMPQQPMQNNQPQMQYSQQPMQANQPQMLYNQQPMPQQQQYYQQMPQQQYAPQMQYAPPQMPQQQFYQPQMPQQQFYRPQQFPSPGQPMPGPMNTQSPAPFLAPIQPWTTGLFDCAEDMENCIITFFFPCITFGQIAEITDRGMSTCMGAGLIYGLLLYFTGLHWVYSWMYRTKLRLLYSLMEDPFHDFLVHCLCDPCALCQEYRELKNRGFNMQLGWAGNMQLQAQNAAAGNVPPPVQGMTR